MPRRPELTDGSMKRRRPPIVKWIGIAIAVVWVVGLLRVGVFNGANASHTDETTTTTATSITSTTAAPTTTQTEPPTTAPPVTTPADAVSTTVKAFVPAWLTPGSPEQRHAALAPTTAPDLLAQLEIVPPEALPQAQLSGEPRVESAQESTALVTATLSDGTLFALRVQRSGDGPWLVTAVDKPAGPTAAPPSG